MNAFAVVETTGEVTFCDEVDAFDDYVIADMVFIPTKDIFEILEVTIDA